MNILVLNAGSSSLKYSLYQGADSHRVAHGVIDQLSERPERDHAWALRQAEATTTATPPPLPADYTRLTKKAGHDTPKERPAAAPASAQTVSTFAPMDADADELTLWKRVHSKFWHDERDRCRNLGLGKIETRNRSSAFVARGMERWKVLRARAS